MSASKIIKQIMIERGISVKDLAIQLEVKPQVLSNKLYRDTFSYNEYIKIVNALGCNVQTITNDSHKVFINEYTKNRKVSIHTPAIKEISTVEQQKNHPIPLDIERSKKQYQIFTEAEAAKIDLTGLLTDMKRQIDIAETFGMDVLIALTEKARQQINQKEPNNQKNDKIKKKSNKAEK